MLLLGGNPESIFDASGVYEVKLIEDNVMARREQGQS